MRVIAALITLSLAGLSSASAQSLADVAQKESERRQATTTGKSVLESRPQADAASSARRGRPGRTGRNCTG